MPTDSAPIIHIKKTYRLAEAAIPQEDHLIALEKYDLAGRLVEQFTKTSEGEERQLTEYNEAGNLLKEEYYFNGSLAHTTGYEYDAEGNLLVATVTYPHGGVSIRTYTYDQDGGISIVIESESGEYEGEEYRRYNEQGWLLEKTMVNESNETTEQIVQEFDAEGRLLKKYEEVYGGIGAWYFYEYELDEQGKVAKASISDAEGIVLRTEAYTRDEHDQVLQIEIGMRLDGEMKNLVMGYAFDEQHRLTEEWQTTGDGEVSFAHRSISYNENGLPDSETDELSGEVTHYLYEFFPATAAQSTEDIG